MFVDGRQFPIVWMYNEGHPIEQTFEEITGAFETVLVREQPFVLIAIGTDRPAMSRDKAENKRVGLWIKTNKHRFKICRKMVLIEPSAVKRIGLGSALTMFAKFWGFSVAVVASEDEALATAKTVVAEAPLRVD